MIGHMKSAGISLAALVTLVTLLPVNCQSTGDNHHAPNVLEQFQNLAEQGDPMAVHVGVGLRDYGPAEQGRPCKHYQGLARGSLELRFVIDRVTIK